MKSHNLPSQECMIALRIEERLGRARINEPVRIGIPFPRGLVYHTSEIAVFDQHEQIIPHQFRIMASWSDRSIKWILMDGIVCVEAYEYAVFFVRQKNLAPNAVQSFSIPVLEISQENDRLIVNTGSGKFFIARDFFGPLSAALLGSTELLAAVGSQTRLRTTDGIEYFPVVDSLEVEENGLIRASILVQGSFAYRGQRTPLLFKSRLIFFAGLNYVCVEFQIRNPQAACHPGGLWDLGDSGSFSFTDLSIRLHPRTAVRDIQWYTEYPQHMQFADTSYFSLYQDSSGGENWDSPNHVDFEGKLTVSFPGYQVRSGLPDQWKLIAEGRRATPCLSVSTDAGWIAATTKDFWQNFPKALRLENGVLSIGLFPSECSAGFELQGGEQKRHIIFLDFGLHERESLIPMMQNPLAVSVDPVWIEHSEALSYFSVAEHDNDQRYSLYIENIIVGPNSFFRKREVVDEYGWRNFGDLYADHEVAHHHGPKPMVSHYNNQYDFIYGALIHFLRTGDSRWHHLMEAAARHTIDIDIYHTNADRAAYNGGLFWHTDHYKDAATCSHRTYSRCNGGPSYGGGPSNEHNYTSGLLHYYYLSGDSEAAAALLELANWVIAMDDGSHNLLGLIDAGPTGLASKTTSNDYHGPGRGAGNSINALLDAYKLVCDRRYMVKAEELIQRCIHPTDHIPGLRLDEPEYRWSYLVFLQVLGKYLDMKVELGETDYFFHYARESLLHYADWMVENEAPYKDVLHKVLIPTETWPAHDIRKSHILYLASKYAKCDKQMVLKQRADFFFERCLKDLLSFETAYLTRPLVILCVYGYIHAYFQRQADTVTEEWNHDYLFGKPHLFLPQRARLKSELRRKLGVASTELRRILGDKLWSLKNRVFPSR